MSEIKVYLYQKKLLDALKKDGAVKLKLYPQRYSKSDFARVWCEAMKRLGFKEWKPEVSK